MENQKNDKKRFFLITVLFSTLIITIIIWGILDYLNTGKKSGLGALFVALIIVILGFKLIKDKFNSLKRGEPFKDERSRKLETKAGAYAFYIGIYWLLGIGFAIDSFNLNIPASSVPSVGIAGLAIIFALSYWYLSKKGE